MASTATRSTISTSQPVRSSGSSSSNVSAGAAAGIGVGTFFFGLFIALLIVLIFRIHIGNRVRRTQNRESSSFSILDELPQPRPHERLKQEMMSFDTSIKNYVDNFYHDRALPASQVLDERQLGALVEDAGRGRMWADLLINPEKRDIVLRAFVANVIFKRIDPNGNAMTTLLPPEVATCYHHALAKTKAHRLPLMRGTWRAMTAYLLSESYPENDISNRDSRHERVARIASEIVHVLEPFAKHSTTERSVEILRRIVLDAATFGWKLFAQSNSVTFVWHSQKEGGLVVLPGLKQSIQGEQKSEDQVVLITKALVE